MKERLKLLKLALKDWHLRHSHNLPAKILSLKDKITSFDLKGETEDLLESELEEYHGLTEDLFSLSRSHASICWQQSRAHWLREGDANSKKIHGIMSSRRRGNVVSCFLVDGVLIEGVDNVRRAVFLIFLLISKRVMFSVLASRAFSFYRCLKERVQIWLNCFLWKR